MVGAIAADVSLLDDIVNGHIGLKVNTHRQARLASDGLGGQWRQAMRRGNWHIIA